ncbi:MAG TPA: hypothetical protein VGP82_11605 [Ktedonobacterales bacterium]|jgi:hypothetical protein|nr:hypothetical protein [Ktedonobacterales bacterium]
MQDDLTDLHGVMGVSPVYRGAPSADLDNGDSMDLLGVNPGSFGHVASSTWSGEYANQPLVASLRDIGDQA